MCILLHIFMMFITEIQCDKRCRDMTVFATIDSAG